MACSTPCASIALAAVSALQIHMTRSKSCSPDTPKGHSQNRDFSWPTEIAHCRPFLCQSAKTARTSAVQIQPHERFAGGLCKVSVMRFDNKRNVLVILQHDRLFAGYSSEQRCVTLLHLKRFPHDSHFGSSPSKTRAWRSDPLR